MIAYVWQVWSNVCGVVVLVAGGAGAALEAWKRFTGWREWRRRELRGNTRVIQFPPRAAP